jgi:ABC-type glucose/galactose transport system permease subunit
MVSGLIALLIVVIVVAVVASVLVYCVDMLPIDPRFQQIIKVLIMLVAVLIILFRALPLLGVSV